MDLVDDSISFEIHNISVNVTTLNKSIGGETDNWLLGES